MTNENLFNKSELALVLLCAASMSFGAVYVDANSEAASPDCIE